MNSINHMEKSIIFFDGACNLCSAVVQFVIKHDKSRFFRFASLQSSIGQQLLDSKGFSKKDLTTFFLLQDGVVYTRSTAALRVCMYLNGIWPIFYILIIVPPFIRNAIYSLVSSNRYRLFGKSDICWLPSPEFKELFIF